MGEKSYAEVLFSFFEYKASFLEPAFEIQSQAGNFARALYRAFCEWGVSLTNITWNPNPANAAEVKTTVELPNRRYVFTVGFGELSLSVTDPSWEETELITRVAKAGIEAVKLSVGAEVAQQATHLLMHLRPKVISSRAVTSRFVNADLMVAAGEEVRAQGLSIYTEDGSWVVDLSAIDTEALFIKMSRTFDSSTSFDAMADKIGKDQEHLLEKLGLRIS